MKNNPNIRHGLPVSVDAPIILDATTQAGVQPLLDYIGGLQSNSNEAVAAAEGRRLAPYFTAMSNYLTRALEVLGVADESVSLQREKLDKLATPGALQGLFNAAARRTHNTIISSVALLPGDVLTEGPAAPLFGGDAFKVPYSYNGHMFSFGFLQVFEGGGDKKTSHSSTSFPTFILDREMMKAVAAHEPLGMLKEFQDVMSWVNHDMLHHFTTPTVVDKVAAKFTPDHIISADGTAAPLQVWARTLPAKTSYGVYYEEWAQIGHEKTILTPANAAQLGEVSDKITRFFGDLTRVGQDIAKDKGPGKAHEAVDYFGMVMAHALSRVFPLNHPVMTHCLDCMQKADPLPAKYLEDAERMAPQVKETKFQALREYFGLATAKEPPQAGLASIRSYASKPFLARVVDSYRLSGFDILPADDAKVGYGNIKLLQLIDFSAPDINPHIPQPPDGTMMEMRLRTDRAMVGMLTAASQSYNYPPK